MANDEVKNGCSERGGFPVEQKKMKQWSLRITAYADRLNSDLNSLNWSDSLKEMQRNWIGKSNGAEIKYLIEESDEYLTVFSTRPDTIFGVSFLAISPNHSISLKLAETDSSINKFLDRCKETKAAEADMAKAEKLGIDTGISAIHPLTGKKIPVWIGNFVLLDYGTGVVMGVPGHDQRDFEFASKYLSLIHI